MITGGREVLPAPASLRAFVSWLHHVMAGTVRHGKCPPRKRKSDGKLASVDYFVSQYVIAETDLAVDGWPALWDQFKDSAGPRRNGCMLVGDRRDWDGEHSHVKADALVRWPGGRGTRDCAEQAQRNGIPVYSIDQIAEWMR